MASNWRFAILPAPWRINLLRDPASGVQAALTTFGFTQPADMDILYSLGGIFDAAIFIFYRDAEPITMFAQLRGKRVGMGVPGTALRSLMLDVLRATDALDTSKQSVNLDYATSIDALISGSVDVAIVPAMENGERTITAPGIRLMSVAQAEAIAKTVPGLKHVVLWRGLIDLSRDIPNSDVDLLALRNRLLVRKELHPALQYLLLEAMREVHSAPGPFNRFGELGAEPRWPRSLRIPSSLETVQFARIGRTHERDTKTAVFGMIFTVIIALEFERSLLVIAERDRGVVQVRTVILNALLAIVRKQMIIRYVGNERPAAFCARCCCPGAWRRVLAGARSGRARRRLTMSAWGTGDHQETILIIRRLEKARMEADWDARRSTRRPSAI